MTEGTNLRCQIVCWVIAAIVGITVLAVWVALGLWALLGLFGAVVAAGVTGWLLGRVFCADTRSEVAERQEMFDVAARALDQPPAAGPSVAPAAARAVAEDPAAVASHDRTGAVGPGASDDDGAQDAEDDALAAAAQPDRDPAASEAGPQPEPEPASPGPARASEPASPRPAPASEPASPGPEADAPAAETAGTRPEGLSEPRDGKPDNLKSIKGVGPKLEQLLQSMGYYHFDQIAGWTDAEVAWVDENLQGFKGRVSRDNWVEQARVLAAGGDTEFSGRAGRDDAS